MKIRYPSIIILAGCLTARIGSAPIRPVAPVEPAGKTIAVARPGYYATPGTTYQLTQNISKSTSPIFLGKNVTLDLNGYTITYAEANYENIPNYDFEEGSSNWDLSLAPTARIEDDKVQVFTGKHVLRLSKGEEIVSQYISLPVGNRSYFAICGVASWDMKISLFVEDEKGQSIECFSTIGDSTKQCCPIDKRAPRLGGGFITAHIHGQPVGKYRVRVHAETDCLVDHIDLRPAMDVGISIVENTRPKVHNDDLYNGRHAAFFDYTNPGTKNEPITGIPRVHGAGKIFIKNGTIKSGATGVLSWGVQSTAQNVTIILENVKIIAEGINTNAVDVPQAKIQHCVFDIKTPFIINRHVSEHAVVLRGPKASHVSFSEFYGGQGCLTIKGENSEVHDNLFVNRQTVTNHYSVMVMGDGSHIHHNLFKPEIGSGVEIYRHKRIHIYENEFHIEAAPPTCEYGHEEYSTTAIRVADYDADPESDRGCADNRIYSNTFYITGKDYPAYPDYIPMAWAFFHSVSGGDTYIYDNEIVVEHLDPNSKAEAAAIYIGGSRNGGIWTHNNIRTNVPAAWIASRYGSASNATFRRNTITLSGLSDTKPFRIGWDERQEVVATHIHFDSNSFPNAKFAVDITDRNHTFTVSWTLGLRIIDRQKEPVADVSVHVLDNTEKLVSEQRTDEDGCVLFVLDEFRYGDGQTVFHSPYKVVIGKEQHKVKLDRNQEINIQLN